MEPALDDIIHWARQAGSILREGYGKRHQIDYKGRIDLVTEMDQRSETYLLEQVRSHFPDHAIETEESGFLPGINQACWYIDPLDGTTNYAHAIPIFSVSVAYARDGKLQAGVVYDPMRDECFSAERGKGAQLNGETIHVSENKELIYSLLVTGFPYDFLSVSGGNIPAFAHFSRLTQGVRRLGSAALDLCYVAAGRFEGYWEQTLRPYDFAAGALIAEEAGGRVTNLSGDSDLFQPPYAILAGNPDIHALMVQAFREL
jgi:myo-inositol-1(or 4)-monophosphatase